MDNRSILTASYLYLEWLEFKVGAPSINAEAPLAGYRQHESIGVFMPQLRSAAIEHLVAMRVFRFFE